MKKFKLIKRILVIITVVVWISALVNIFDPKTPFSSQAPKCLFSTMIIFGILIGVFKIIEKFEKDVKND
jgi:hypothetical protein